MKTNYEYIILGCGGIGSGAAYWLARRAGREVLGLEQFALNHPHGGSQDHSRIIRLAYNDLAYAPLAPHSFAAWATLEEESAVRVVTKTGGLWLAPPESPFRPRFDSYTATMEAAGVPYERLDAAEVLRRYPQFRLEADIEALFQAETGIADPSKGNAAHIALARAYGASILDYCPVEAIRPYEGGVEVVTAQGNFSCRKLIMTAGAWTDRILTNVGVSLKLMVTQEQVTYYATPNLRQFAIGHFPIFLWYGNEVIYGFPVYGEVATKVAIDLGGQAVTVDSRTYEADPAREKVVETWLRQHIPAFLGPKLYTKTCLYTLPRDRNFIVDALPQYPQILACVGAGHAYKFASLLGKILSQLAIDDQTEYPIAPFTLRRPAITDPNFKPTFHLLGYD
jgi:sarcosine oxidase